VHQTDGEAVDVLDQVAHRASRRRRRPAQLLVGDGADDRAGQPGGGGEVGSHGAVLLLSVS
jgi:hypothetical protein